MPWTVDGEYVRFDGTITWSGNSTGSGTLGTLYLAPTTSSSTYTLGSGWHLLGALGTDSIEPAPRISPEERERRDREHRERIERHAQELREAEERARTLLISFLSEEQRVEYERGQQFEVIGSAGGRYRIRQGMVGNIDWLDGNGERCGSLCCHPANDLPHPDVMLAQMLALITDEEAFVRLANRYSGSRHPLARRALGV